MNLAFEFTSSQSGAITQRRLGKAPARGHAMMLNFSDYAKKSIAIPETYNYYKRKVPVPVQDWGNTEFGDCTIASQGILSQYMERQEQRRTVAITRDSIIDTYFNMVERVYGSREDMGAYEIDALNNWRNKDYTFKDVKGRAYTIDAYTRINHSNISEVKKALFLSGAKGIKVCFSLPWAWAIQDASLWDIPENSKLTGDYAVGSWGGHSMTAIANYDTNFLTLRHSWNIPDGKISWRAFAAYCDEAYLVIDSVNDWKKKLNKKEINFSALVSDVNMVSDVKIEL